LRNRPVEHDRLWQSIQEPEEKRYLFTAENAENAEMTEKERLNRITESIIGAAIEVHRAFKAQLLSYLRLSGYKVGLLINFNVKVLKDGVRRVVNDFPDSPRSLRAQR
jgi:uncharacterized protein YpmS